MAESHPIISGIAPHLAAVAEMGPPRTECGIGALMPWADRLWMISYASSNRGSGLGMGLYEIDQNLTIRKRPESIAGTYANRMVHHPSNQLIIGPHLIDAKGNVRTSEELSRYRLASTMEHLTEPKEKVYFLGMEGHFFELNVHDLTVKQLFNLTEVLRLPKVPQPHFKAAFTAQGRVIVANNSYDERSFLGEVRAGRLAEWAGDEWRIIDDNPYNEVFGRKRLGNAIFATGWDRASAILKLLTSGTWRTYRLPKGSHIFDQYWATEWPRIREVNHERLLMDCHGIFYELSPHAYGGHVWGIRPICTHLWAIPDFCTFRGLFVIGTDQETSSSGDNLLAAQPQSGLWLGKIEDLWSFGKPAGWGGPWCQTEVEAGRPSDPYLMTGFDKKCLHLCHDSSSTVRFKLEVDFLGWGEWRTYDTFEVASGAYLHHEFPSGFSAHWARLLADSPCRATAYFTYT